MQTQISLAEQIKSDINSDSVKMSNCHQISISEIIEDLKKNQTFF